MQMKEVNEMFNYEEFKMKVSKDLRNRAAERFQGVEVREESAKKMNCVKDGIAFSRQIGEDTIAPILYFDDLYQAYAAGEDYDWLIKRAMISLEYALNEAESVIRSFGKEIDIRSEVLFEVMHTKENESLLKDLVHREFLDLSIVYKRQKEDLNWEGSSYITKRLAEQSGLTEEELYQCAYENTKRFSKPVLRSVEDVRQYFIFKMKEVFDIEEVPERTFDDNIGLYLLSNANMKKGACMMLYKEKLQELAEKLDSDLYVLPASVNGVIITSANGVDAESLAGIVYDMNQTCLTLEERLSNQVYFYDRQAQSFSQATHTEHTMLSEMDAVSLEQSGINMEMRM